MNDRSRPLILTAPAKINLGLEVLRRRPDGYHDINTLFAAISLHDRLELHPRSDGGITCSVPSMPALESDPTNLCVRAAILLRESLERDDLGLDIVLGKRIPVGAGLGGGSSDAAAVLIGASRLWSPEIDDDHLLQLAARLGSDVPFFIRGGVALGSSRGEILEAVDLELPFSLLLLFPGIHVSTPWAYRAIGRNGGRPMTDLVATLREGVGNPAMLRERLVNDFEEPVFREHPSLAVLKDRLYGAGALYAAMSGSGSTLFGLYATKDAADDAAGAFTDVAHAVAGFEPAGGTRDGSFRES